MSPRAACRLESLGFSEVYDYSAGKADWFAAGLPREGALTTKPAVGDLAHAEVPTCTLADEAGAVSERIAKSKFDVCYVVTEDGCLLGELDQKAVRGADRAARAGDAMRPGPSTFRPNVPLEEMAEYMKKHELTRAPITSSDGQLIGVLLRSDVEKRLSHED
jgi:Mg/Co/Ni transporter MgtE